MDERPVECTHCKKPADILYKEIVGSSIICTQMCSDCPVLQQKLRGKDAPISGINKLAEGGTGMCCGNCRTTLESVQTGNPFGCSECYDVFADLLIAELGNQGKIPARIKKEIAAKKMQSLHIGKTPGKSLEIPSSSRLTALNEALNEALKKENYEHAAWLRDQIKALTEKGSNDRKE